MHTNVHRRTLTAFLVAGAVLSSGCEPLSMTMMSVGASAGVAHTLGGIVYRTFSASAKRVEQANRLALRHMGMEILSRESSADGEIEIRARARDRDIRILLEPITNRTTRIRAIASNGILMDGATAAEIVDQTDLALGDTRAVSLNRDRRI